jgi:ABC-2 type transport system ATP-binding protein
VIIPGSPYDGTRPTSKYHKSGVAPRAGAWAAYGVRVLRLRRGHVTALVLACAVLVATIGWHAADRPPGYRLEDQMVTVFSGPARTEPLRLDTRLYLPDSATPNRPAPAVLLGHGFGGTKESVDRQARDLATRGYVVLAWTARGFGRSGGRIHLASPEYEVNDARGLLDWLAARPDVRKDGPGDPKVGVVGASYGGALALLLAGHDRRVDAIVPQATWNNLANALFPESTGQGPAAGVFKRAWAGWMFAAGSGRGGVPRCGRFATDICRMYERAAQSGRTDAATLRLLAHSSPAEVLNRIVAPTLLVQGTADTLFPLSEAEANASGIAAAGTRVRMLWYSGGHDGGPGSNLDQWRIERATVGWLDHHLRGTGRGPVGSFVYSRVTGVDAGGTGSVRTLGLFAWSYPHLDGDRPLREVPLAGHVEPLRNPPSGTPAAVSTVPGLGSVAAGALARSMAFDIPDQSVSYESSPLTASVDVTGSPTVRIRAASPSGSAVLFVKMYDVAPDGTLTLPGGGVAPVRLNGLPATIDRARPRTVTLPGVVYRFAAGHRIRVTLASADQAYAGPAAPTVYSAGLAGGPGTAAGAGGTVRLPQVYPRTAGDPGSGWLAILGGVVGALAFGGLLGWALLRLRSRRRGRAVDPEYADTPLVVRGLGKAYGSGLTALADVDLQVRRGEVVGLLGPNGAGKTTCLRIVLGLIRPTAGNVLLFGHRLTSGVPALSRVGALVDGPGLLAHRSGRDNLELYWQATGRPLADARMDDVQAVAGLGAALDRKVRTYSRGMKQRLAIAQAMLGMPDLLLLDEPTEGLDPPQIAALRGVLRRYAAGGRGVLVSSHLLAEVEQTCTHVVVLHHGRRVVAGRVDDITADSTSVIVDVDDVERAEEVVGDLDVRSVARHNGGLVIDLAGVARSELVRSLVAAGVGVGRVAPRQRLEDAFLSYVGGGHPEGEPPSTHDLPSHDGRKDR